MTALKFQTGGRHQTSPASLRGLERTNKAEIRPEEQSEKVASCQENSWNEMNTVERAIKTETDTRTE